MFISKVKGWGALAILLAGLGGWTAETEAASDCKYEQGAKKSTSTKNDKGYTDLFDCPPDYFLKSDRAGGKPPRVVGLLGRKEMAGAIVQVGNAKVTCQYQHALTTKCSEPDFCLKDNAFTNDYCAPKSTLIAVEPPTSDCPGAPTEDKVDVPWRTVEGLDLCSYYIKPKLKQPEEAAQKSQESTKGSATSEAREQGSTTEERSRSSETSGDRNTKVGPGTLKAIKQAIQERREEAATSGSRSKSELPDLKLKAAKKKPNRKVEPPAQAP